MLIAHLADLHLGYRAYHRLTSGGINARERDVALAFRQFSRLRAQLPDAPVVVIAGNHDSPRAVETGSILRLFAEIPSVWRARVRNRAPLQPHASSQSAIAASCDAFSGRFSTRLPPGQRA